MQMIPSPQNPPVARLHQLPGDAMPDFLRRHGLALTLLPEHADIPGSYWGAPEAGLVGNAIYARPDTPVHSILHTACHWLCMDESRRARVHTNAGGDDIEEVAVCYLQCLLSDDLPGYRRDLLFGDMDAWGYHFRLGSAEAWFHHDSDDAQTWLRRHPLLGPRVMRESAISDRSAEAFSLD